MASGVALNKEIAEEVGMKDTASGSSNSFTCVNFLKDLRNVEHRSTGYNLFVLSVIARAPQNTLKSLEWLIELVDSERFAIFSPTSPHLLSKIRRE